MKKKTVILIGAGSRGQTYTKYVFHHKDEYQVVAVAEPIENRRDAIRDLHEIPEELCFPDWRPLLAKPKMADACFICTMDRDHFAPAMAAIEKGYEILLEKPAGATPEECLRLADYAEDRGVNVLICHVLRYTPFFIALKNLLDSGKIGEVMQINHNENVGNVHQSHSFVRGNWGNTASSSPMLLQKSCHDLDILQWLVGKKCTRVQSFGTLSYFTKANQPAGAPERCIEGCPAGETCPYNAVKLYLLDEKNNWFRRSATKNVAPTNADVEKALRETDYGRCVFDCNNDVVDHQVVNIEFENGVYANFSMAAFNKGGREIFVMGTKGTLHGKMSEDFFTWYDFASKSTAAIPIADAIPGEMITGGHGGGDNGIMDAFFARLKGSYHGNSICDISESCENHMIAFAAEESRLSGSVVSLEDYIRRVREKMNQEQ